MSDSYKIELGVSLNDKQFNDIKRQLNNLTDNTHRVRIDIDNSRLLKQIEHAKKELKGLNSTKNNQPSLNINTKSLEESLSRVANSIDEVVKSLGTIDNKSGMQSLVASVNQIVTALGKAEDESDSLIKSLSTLSKKEFGFNFNLKTGNTNPVKAATDYGIEARRKAIPAMQEQVAYLKNILGGTEKADKALERYLVKLHKGFGGVTEKNRLQQEMVGGVGSDGKQISYNKQMGAYEQTIDHLKKIIVESGKSLAGFDAQFSKSAENIVDDTVKIQTGAKQTEEALESVGKEMKQIFGGGIGAEQLSGQLEPIITDLKKIREAIEGLSKGVSFDGLTASFDRLSSSIENLLKNAEKVKGVLNSGFDSPSIGANIGSTGVSTTSQKKAQKQANSYLDSYLKYWNISGSDAEKVKSKFMSFAESSSHGISYETYDESVEDLVNTIKQLGTASRQADDYLEKVFKDLRSYSIDAPKDIYKQDFGDDWSIERSRHQAILANKNSKIKLPVDVAYQELNEKYKSLFPEDIWNPSDQLKKIFEVYDIAKDASKDRLVSLSEQYSDSDLRGEVLDIVSTMQEQVKAEKELAQSSVQTANSIAQDEARKRQEYEETLAKKKQEVENYNRLIAEYEDVINDPTKLRADSPEGRQDELQMYMDGLDDAYGIRDGLLSEIKQIESALESTEQQAKQTADAIQSVSKNTSLVRDDVGFERVFEASNQAAQKAQTHFQKLLSDEKAVISVTEQFDDNNALQSFAVNVKRANGEVETLRYSMRNLAEEGEDDNWNFVYQGASSNDKSVNKQLDKRIKKASDLQIQLDKIKTGYSNLGASKPIKEEAHIQSLAEQYDVVQTAIENVKNADNATFASMESNAKKEIATLESLVKIYRDAETFSTDLRAKDRDTAKEVYSSRLDVLSSKMKKDGVYAGLESDVSALSTKISGASEVKTLSEIANELTKLDAKYKSAKAAKDEFNNAQNVGSSVSGLKSEIEILQNASPSIKSFKTEINGAEVSIESLLKDLSQVDTKGDFNVVKNRVEAFGKAAEAAGIDLNEAKAEVKKANDAYKQMLEVQKQIRSLSIKEKNLTEFGNTNELNEVSAKLKDLKSDYETLKRTFGDKLTSTQFGNLQAEIDETESELKQLDAKFADTKAKLAKDIEIDLNTGKFTTKVKQVHSDAKKLSSVTEELQLKLDRLDEKEIAMNSTFKSGTVDERIKSYREYKAALQDVENQLKQNKLAEDNTNNITKLNQKKQALSLDMDNWLKDNSAVAKKFGATIRELKTQLESCNDVQYGNIKREFQNIQREAKSLGLTTQTLGDKLKKQFAQYSTYLGVAEIFMWVEQGMRDMFEQIKLIDSAMTELKKVTNETDASYNKFLTNAASRAKEIGTTIDGLVSSTADFARLGFGFKDAQGLAEVANIYAVVGDDIDSVETATQSLISTLTAFKNEMGDMDNSEFALSIVDKMNEVANNYAISSGGIGDALQRSASSMMSANNSLDETIALITAANTVVDLCHPV